MTSGTGSRDEVVERGSEMDGLRVRAADDVAGTARDTPFEFHFSGRSIRAYPGETVGAALMAAGVTTFRTTRRFGRPRGLFCGIGVCFDCLLIVDGAPNQRACLTAAHPNMVVEPQEGTGEGYFGR